MSVLNKIPFINNVLAHLSGEELKTLLNLMNGLGDRIELNRILGIPSGNRTNISAADKGVHMCSLQIGPSLSHGYLLYSDFACVLLSFTDFQRISMFDIDVSKNNYEIVAEYLDINELRSQVNDLLTEAGELGDIVAKMEVSDITAMTKDQLDKLEPGDVVNKITGNAVHSYRVSYKGTGAGTGICLTYSDAGYLETVSYDRSGNDWVYNSTDVCDISSLNELPDTVSASEGDVLSLNASKEPQWSAPAGGGTKLYKHTVKHPTNSSFALVVIDNNPDAIDNSNLRSRAGYACVNRFVDATNYGIDMQPIIGIVFAAGSNPYAFIWYSSYSGSDSFNTTSVSWSLSAPWNIVDTITEL